MRLLLLAPHCDDEMAALPIYFYIQKRSTVELEVLSFSSCEETAQSSLGYEKDAIAKEEQAALSALGIPHKNIYRFQFRVRRFSEYRQEILEKLIKTRSDFTPDIVIGSGSSDVHQDHRVVYEEMLRCFKNSATVIGFCYPWNTFCESNNIFIELDETMVQKVVAFTSFFKTQKHKHYMQEDFIRAQFMANGVKIGKPFAAAYQLIRFRGTL